MLIKVRIEVEEDSAEKCVETLSKYEHAIQQQEAKRFQYLWPCTEEGLPPIEDHAWRFGVAARTFYNEELGRTIVEEVIEYDPKNTIAGYRGRRVITFTRADTRHPIFAGDEEATVEANEVALDSLNRMLPGRP